MDKVKSRLLKNWGLKFVSLILALLIWFLVAQILNPKGTTSFNNVPVTFLNEEVLDQENKVFAVRENSDLVRVSVEAPKSVIDSLQASDIVAEADLSLINDEGQVPITVYVATTDTVDSITSSREYVKLTVEDKVSKYVPLTTKTKGSVAEGYLLHTVSLDQNMIEISGPQSSVNQVSYAGVEIDVNGASGSMSANMEINLYNSDDRVVSLSSLKKQTTYAHVSVEVLATKKVSIYGSKTGTAASGYAYNGNLSISPASVVIAGTTADLTGVSRITISDSVDITGAKANVEYTTNIASYLPSGIILADADYDGEVTVTVPVEALQNGVATLLPENIEFTNVPEGYNFVIKPVEDGTTYSVVISGLQADLEEFQSGTVSGFIDIIGWMDSTDRSDFDKKEYLMPVTLNVDGTVVQTGDLSVYVQVEEAEGDE